MKTRGDFEQEIEDKHRELEKLKELEFYLSDLEWSCRVCIKIEPRNGDYYHIETWHVDLLKDIRLDIKKNIKKHLAKQEKIIDGFLKETK